MPVYADVGINRYPAPPHIERSVDVVGRAVVGPAAKVLVHRAARRQFFGDVALLKRGAQHVHRAVEQLAHIGPRLAAAARRGRAGGAMCIHSGSIRPHG